MYRVEDSCLVRLIHVASTVSLFLSLDIADIELCSLMVPGANVTVVGSRSNPDACAEDCVGAFVSRPRCFWNDIIVLAIRESNQGFGSFEESERSQKRRH
jgi:hypothetical protein